MIPIKVRKVSGVMFLVLLFLLPAISRAEEVQVKGIGVAPVTRDEASARRVSLQLAKRDAVERAIGAKVQASAIPSEELTRVVATTSGRLEFEIISESVEGKVYITEIKATVEIPPGLASKYPKSVEEEKTGYQPLVQPFPHGELNWRDGYLLAKGAAKLDAKDEKSKAKAKRAARLDAYGIALQMVSGINFDPEETVEQRIKRAPRVEYSLRGLIRGAEVVDEEAKDGIYQVTIKVPLRGIKGVQQAFLDNMKVEPPKGPVKEAEKDDVYTGVIVDARGIGLDPAVFPEVVDESGEPVYSLQMIEPSALKQRGAAAYVTGEKEDMDEGKKGAFIPGRHLYVKAKAAEPAAVSFISLESSIPEPSGINGSDPKGGVSFFKRSLSFIAELAQGTGRRIVMRYGPRPAKPKAKKSTGPTKSRIVISNSDAKKIREADTKNNFLRMARVVVITDSMIGGTEGRLHRFFKLVPASN